MALRASCFNAARLIGGEESGHIIFAKYATTGDGVLTSIKLMQAMLDQKLPMSKLAEPVVLFPRVQVNVKVFDKDAAINNPAVQAAYQQAQKELEGSGRALMRKSGTEPVVRVMAEASEKETCQKYVDRIIDAMKSEGLVKE